ncbi:MAG: sigma-70 family RNA polymerase sigma factor [Bacteroidota bacterium]|jgi:RNA polymerase sigma-70 factor (ECF subfamily)
MTVLDPEIQEDVHLNEAAMQESAEDLRKRHLDFEREALPHMDALYNFALRMTSDPDEADDLLQETFLKAYRFFDKFEQGTNCKAWLFRIMKNSFINIYRRTSKEPDKVDYNDVEDFYHSIRAESTDPNDLEERIFSNILDDDVSTALESLPEDFRTVVILCDIEGFTYEEIADFVECPIGTVRSRLHRGRKMLRVKLYDYAKQRGFSDDDDEKE